MITLLGTGHVFDLRKRVQEEIFRRSPDVVCLELDPARYRSLRAQSRGHVPNPKDVPLFYRMLAGFQARIAGEYGVNAGDEMLAASDAAQDLRVPIALIDVDAQATFQRAWREMRASERLRLGASLVSSMFTRSGSVDAQVREMEDNYDLYFRILGDKFPTLKRVLLDERNTHMARALRELAGKHANVLAVVGDGHVDGVSAILRDEEFELDVVRLKNLRTPNEPAPGEGGTSASFTVDPQ